MASKIKVDQIEGSTGSTITVPTGQTFTITDGLAGTGANLTALNATQITSGTIPDVARLPTVTVAKGGTNLSSFTAGDLLYATGSTTLAKLAKGTAAQQLAMNSGATAPEWTTVSGGAVVGIHNVYNSSTETYVSGQAGTNLTGSTYYPMVSRIGGTFTKAQAGSKLMIHGHMNVLTSNTNLHGTMLWRVGDEANFINMGMDSRTFSFYEHGSNGIASHSYCGYFTGVAAGSQTFYYAHGVDGTRTHTLAINANPQSNSIQNWGDAPSGRTTSTMFITEYN